MKSLTNFIIILLFGCTNSNNKCTKDDAIKIAVVEWLKSYGKGIYNNQPFKATLKNDTVWVVVGTLPEDFMGGVPMAKINAKTCEIITISHGK